MLLPLQENTNGLRNGFSMYELLSSLNELTNIKFAVGFWWYPFEVRTHLLWISFILFQTCWYKTHSLFTSRFNQSLAQNFFIIRDIAFFSAEKSDKKPLTTQFAFRMLEKVLLFSFLSYFNGVLFIIPPFIYATIHPKKHSSSQPKKSPGLGLSFLLPLFKGKANAQIRPGNSIPPSSPPGHQCKMLMIFVSSKTSGNKNTNKYRTKGHWKQVLQSL